MKNFEILIPLILVIVAVVRVLKAVAEAQQSRKNDWGEGDFEEGQWTDLSEGQGELPDFTGQQPPPPPPRETTPSMRGFEPTARDLYDTPSAAPPPPPMAPASEPLALDEIGAGNTEAASIGMGEMGGGREPVDYHLTTPTPNRTFPAAPVSATGIRRRRAPLRISLRGTAALRRGVVLREILDHPRAFDV